MADRVKRKYLPKKAYYYFSQDLLKNIRQMTDAEKIAELLFTFQKSDAALWFDGDNLPSPIRSDSFKDGFGSPTPKEINRFFRRLGYESLEADVNMELNGQKVIFENAIEQLVDQRVKIAHGDPVIASTERDVKAMEDQIVTYCKAVDVVVRKHFRGVGCRFGQSRP